MINEQVTSAEDRRYFYGGRLPLFDHIAQGFLKVVASCQKIGLFAVLKYLDGTVMIDRASYTRRTVVLAMEDLELHIEAPLTLQSGAHAQMSLLKLNPIPELKLYGDIATAILRMDSALRTGVRVTSIEETMGALELWHARQRAITESEPADVIPIEETMGALELWYARQKAIIESEPADVIPIEETMGALELWYARQKVII